MQVEKQRRFAAGKRKPRAVCTLCAQEIGAGETLWYHSGTTVCADCFAHFARETLRPFEITLGEEMTE